MGDDAANCSLVHTLSLYPYALLPMSFLTFRIPHPNFPIPDTYNLTPET
jgi:hypothetical protein